MEVKLSAAEVDHLNRVRTLHREREREYQEINSVLNGLLGMLVQIHGLGGKACTLLPDGTGFAVEEPKNLGQ